MKKAFKIFLIILLLISLVANFFLFKSYDNVYDIEDSRKNSQLIYLMVPTEKLLDLNKDFESISNLDSISEHPFDTLLDQTFSNLLDIQYQLISYSGGMTKNKEFWSPIGKQYQYNYFYTDNYPEHFAFKEFQEIFNNYISSFEKLTDNERSFALLPKNILDVDNINFSEKMFEGMTVSEAVISIEQMKVLMLMDKLKHQLNTMQTK